MDPYFLMKAFDVIGGYGDFAVRQALHFLSNDPMSGAGSNIMRHLFG